MSRRQRSISPWLFIGLPERWTLCSVRGFISTSPRPLPLLQSCSPARSLCPQRSLTGRARVRCWRAAGKFSAIESWQVQVWVKEGREREGEKGRDAGTDEEMQGRGRNECNYLSNSAIIFSCWFYEAALLTSYELWLLNPYTSHTITSSVPCRFIHWQHSTFIGKTASVTSMGILTFR